MASCERYDMLTLEQFEVWARRIGVLGVLGEGLMALHGVSHAWRRPKGHIVGRAYERLSLPMYLEMALANLVASERSSCYGGRFRCVSRARCEPWRSCSGAFCTSWGSGPSSGAACRAEGFHSSILAANRPGRVSAFRRAARPTTEVERDRLLSSNPVRGIKVPKRPPRRNVHLTASQLEKLADESGRYRSLVLLLGVGGLRWGEAAARSRSAA